MGDDMICKDCKFWREAMYSRGYGACYRYPPTPFRKETSASRDYGESDFITVSPATHKDDFCGEFAPCDPPLGMVELVSKTYVTDENGRIVEQPARVLVSESQATNDLIKSMAKPSPMYDMAKRKG